MIKQSDNRTPRSGRIFPERQLSPEEKAKRKADSEALYQRCRLIFERVRPELIENHYDWFIVIEPDSGDYSIDTDSMVALKKLREKHPEGKVVTLRLNETGVCGRI